MKFEKYEKVIIQSRSELRGKLAIVDKVRTDMIKVEIPGDGYMWFQPHLLRKVRYSGSYSAIEPGAPVKITDVKGSYNQRNVIGKSGYANWVSKNMVLVDNTEDYTIYVELGDLQVIPKQKLAYVCLPNRIERSLLTLHKIIGGHAVWKDNNNYIIHDNIVKDTITQALDYQISTGERKNIKVKT